jgi:hypothetical protein
MPYRFLKLLLVAMTVLVTSCTSTSEDLITQAMKNPTLPIQETELYDPLRTFDVARADFYDVATYNTYAHRVSRNAAVRVQLDYGWTMIQGSGTYFKWKGERMVVTAAHLFAFGGDRILESEAFITTPQEKVLGKLVYIDKEVDIAIFSVSSLPSRRAANFHRADGYEIGEQAIYSGFPGPNKLLTFSGTLSGEGYGTDITMHSFAWPGSSGSGVFNEKGEFVGVVVAIMVGGGPMGPQLIGSVVYVAPATLIDSSYLLSNLRKAKEKKNAGF